MGSPALATSDGAEADYCAWMPTLQMGGCGLYIIHLRYGRSGTDRIGAASTLVAELFDDAVEAPRIKPTSNDGLLFERSPPRPPRSDRVTLSYVVEAVHTSDQMHLWQWDNIML